MRILVNSLSEDFGGVESLFFNLIHSKIMDDMQMDFTCSVSRSAREEDYIALGAKDRKSTRLNSSHDDL